MALARPVSKVGWDANQLQDNADGVFKVQANSSRPRGTGVTGAPDRTKHADEDETQDIPELDDGLDTAREVAVPPKISAQRVPAMRDLGNNMPFILPYIHDGNIDLRPLICHLTPVSQVIEDDELWDPDILLRELEFKENADKQNNLPSSFANVSIT